MKCENFNSTLPCGYENVFHIDAKDKKVGIILNSAAITIMAAVAAALILPIILTSDTALLRAPLLLLYFPIYIAYIILHELTHGAAYKIKTGEKLTFGITFSVAFCGVPNIYVYRRSAIFAAAAPLVLFSLIFGAFAAIFLFFDITIYTVFALVFATHLGGCAGDIYLILLLIFKYKDNRTLVRDTGPEQNIFVPVNQQGGL